MVLAIGVLISLASKVHRGAGATVCDVDSGVTLDHLDLKAAIVAGVNTVDPTTPTSFGDDDGHGTYTAGIMVARGTDIWGVAPGASLLVAKAMTGEKACLPPYALSNDH